MRFSKENNALIMIMATLVICLFFMQRAYLPAADEYNYVFIYGTSIKINSIIDIFKSLTNLYQLWTGRILVTGVIQLILYLGQGIYSIINPLIFIIYILYIYININSKEKKNRNILIISIITVILFCVREIGEKCIWLSGSINYLWTCTLMLVVIYYFKKALFQANNLSNKEKIFFWIISFVIGCSQENVIFVLGSFLVICIIFNFKKIFVKKNIVIIVSILLFCMGAFVLIVAPGNFLRFNTSEPMSLIFRLQDNFSHIIFNFKKDIFLVIFFILTITLSIIIGIKNKDNEVMRKIKHQLIYGILPVVIGLIPMLIISEFPERAMFPYETFIILIIISNLDIIYSNFLGDKDRLEKKLKIVMLSMIILDLGINLSISQKYMQSYDDQLKFELQLAKIQNKSNVVLSSFEYEDKISKTLNDILVSYAPTSDKNNLTNMYMAKYYGFDSVCAIDEDEYIISVIFQQDVQLENCNVIDCKSNSIVDISYMYTPQNEIYFIIPQEKLGEYKLELTDILFQNEYNINVYSLNESFQCDSKDVIYNL